MKLITYILSAYSVGIILFSVLGLEGIQIAFEEHILEPLFLALAPLLLLFSANLASKNGFFFNLINLLASIVIASICTWCSFLEPGNQVGIAIFALLMVNSAVAVVDLIIQAVIFAIIRKRQKESAIVI